MITANEWFKTNWENYRKSKVIPLMAKKGIREQGTLLTGEPLKAYVNDGRWIVSCECGGAEFAFEECVFMCMSCLNSNHGHHYRPVEFPGERTQIERLLEVRPLLNRNWYTSESLDELKKENEQHKNMLLEVI